MKSHFKNMFLRVEIVQKLRESFFLQKFRRDSPFSPQMIFLIS